MDKDVNPGENNENHKPDHDEHDHTANNKQPSQPPPLQPQSQPQPQSKEKKSSKFLLAKMESNIAHVETLSTSICPTENANTADDVVGTDDMNVRASNSSLPKNSQECPFKSPSNTETKNSTVETLPVAKQITFSQLFNHTARFNTNVLERSTSALAASEDPRERELYGVFHVNHSAVRPGLFDKFHLIDLVPAHHLNHEFTVQWLWDELIAPRMKSIENAFEDHAMHCLYDPIRLTLDDADNVNNIQCGRKSSLKKTELATLRSKSLQNVKAIDRQSSLNGGNSSDNNESFNSGKYKMDLKNTIKDIIDNNKEVKAKSASFDRIEAWNNGSCLRKIHKITRNEIFLRNQNKSIGDSFLHFLSLIYSTDLNKTNTNIRQALLIRYIRYLYNLHRIHLSGMHTNAYETNTNDNCNKNEANETNETNDANNANDEKNAKNGKNKKASFGEKLQQCRKSAIEPKKEISVTEYRIFVEYIINILRCTIPELDLMHPKYSSGNEALLSSIRYQLEKLSLIFLDELPLPDKQSGQIRRIKTSYSAMQLFSRQLSKFSLSAIR